MAKKEFEKIYKMTGLHPMCRCTLIPVKFRINYFIHNKLIIYKTGGFNLN
jgi:hypothetical protein